MVDIPPVQQSEYTNVIIVIFGVLTMILIFVVLIGYVRCMERRCGSKWRGLAARRTNRHRSTENIEGPEWPLESLPPFLSFEGLSEERPTNFELDPTLFQFEGPVQERLTEIESEPTVIRPEGLERGD